MKSFNLEVNYEDSLIEKDSVVVLVDDDVVPSNVVTWMLDAKESEFGENEKVVAEDILDILVDKNLIRCWSYIEINYNESVTL